MTAAHLAAVSASLGTAALVLLCRRRRRSRVPLWITAASAALGAALCYIPMPRMGDYQTYGFPFPIAVNWYTPKLTAFQFLGVFALLSWILNVLLVREIAALVRGLLARRLDHSERRHPEP